MYLRIPKPTKAELIMMFLSHWNPEQGADKDFHFYQVKAEKIAQKIHKNSKPESVEKAVREAISFRRELENVKEIFDEDASRDIPNGYSQQ